VVHTVAISAFYLAIKYLPMSDALALFHLKPFPVAIMCRLVLNEVISWVQISAMGGFSISRTACELTAVVSFGAAVLVTQPTVIFGSISQHQGSSTAELAIGFVAISVASFLIAVDREFFVKIMPCAEHQ
jgi:drug/metabolite transporter (DMT)-like permease